MEKTTYRIEDSVAIIALHNPKTLHAIDIDMAKELNTLLKLAEKDPQVKVILLTGDEMAFSSGGDMRFLYEQLEQGNPADSALVTELADVILRMKKMEKLIVSAVNRVAAGAGASLAIGCDFCFADEEAVFIQAFSKVGLIPDTGGLYILSKAIGYKRAMELCINARNLKAKEAHELGLVYKLAPNEIVFDEAFNFAKTSLAQGPLLSYALIKKQIFEINFKDFEDYLKNIEVNYMLQVADSMDHKEGVKAFVEKRKPKFKGQ